MTPSYRDELPSRSQTRSIRNYPTGLRGCHRCHRRHYIFGEGLALCWVHTHVFSCVSVVCEPKRVPRLLVTAVTAVAVRTLRHPATFYW